MTDAGALQTQGLTQAELDQNVFSNKLGKEKGHESFWSEISRSWDTTHLGSSERLPFEHPRRPPLLD